MDMDTQMAEEPKFKIKKKKNPITVLIKSLTHRHRTGQLKMAPDAVRQTCC